MCGCSQAYFTCFYVSSSHYVSTYVQAASNCLVAVYGEATSYYCTCVVCFKCIRGCNSIFIECCRTDTDVAVSINTTSLRIDTYGIFTICIGTIEHGVTCNVFDSNFAIAFGCKGCFSFRSSNVLGLFFQYSYISYICFIIQCFSSFFQAYCSCFYISISHYVSTYVQAASNCLVAVYGEATSYYCTCVVCFKCIRGCNSIFIECCRTDTDVAVSINTTSLRIDTYGIFTICIGTIEHGVTCNVFDSNFAIAFGCKGCFSFRSSNVLGLFFQYSYISYTCFNSFISSK